MAPSGTRVRGALERYRSLPAPSAPGRIKRSESGSLVTRDTGSMRVDPADIAQAVALLSRDLSATLGLPSETAEAVARREAIAAAEIMNEWDEDEVSWPLFLARVVEEVQQWLHDTFIDTTWPRCPQHANHPLWLNDDESAGWACAATNTTVCPVGQLGMIVAVDDATAAMNIGRLEANSAQDAAIFARLDRGFRRRGSRRLPWR